MSDLRLPYGDQKTEVLRDRFPNTAPAAAWLAAAYTEVWNAAPWSFKRVSRETFYTTADGTSTGTATASPLMPAAFSRGVAVYDDLGDKLEELLPHEFERRFAGDPVFGPPDTFCVVNRQVQLFPTPDAAYAFTISYRRRLSTRTTAGVFQAGFYLDDSDIPAWDDHHYLLVVRARILGGRIYSDPTVDQLENEYARLLDAMVEDYTEQLPAGTQLPAWGQ